MANHESEDIKTCLMKRSTGGMALTQTEKEVLGELRALCRRRAWGRLIITLKDGEVILITREENRQPTSK